jgi:hypothetical protein
LTGMMHDFLTSSWACLIAVSAASVIFVRFILPP